MEKVSPLKPLSREENQRNTLSPTLWSSFMMAVAGMGDALLYAYLPVEGFNLGLSGFIVGALLSTFDTGIIFGTLSIALAVIWNYFPKLESAHDGN